MRLKRLEITGFKSFRDKVVLDFSPGISGIVGPNGCGKSNIGDAIRWVMGEQRLKTLRGKKMDDVIFNGSEDAPPVGMAEVSMTLCAGEERFPGAYAEFSEVTITRRLFREGESEYMINKIPCRLLDVREFFMGTGVGARTYSLVEQNSVATLVEAKPEERRQFIEEAAGISKYKSRKEAAIRKLEATQQNMVRLNDILREVKGQLSSLSRQARKAQQYKDLKKAIKEAELAVGLQAHRELTERRRRLEEERAASRKREMETQTGLQGLEAGLEEMKGLLLEGENAVAAGQQRLFETKNAINIKEQAIEFTRRKIEDLKARRAKDLAESEALKEREGETKGEIAQLRAAVEQAAASITALRERVDEETLALEELRSKERSCRSEQEEKKVVYIDVVTEKAKAKNSAATLSRILEDYSRRQERESREIAELERKVSEVERSLKALRNSLQAEEGRFEEMQTRQEEVSCELERSRAELEECDEMVANLKEVSSRKSSRLASLKEFDESYSWCNEGVRSLMTSGSDKLPRERFLGLVADHIKVPREYETAVEAVLGEKLQYVVVKDHADGIRAIDYLKSASLGRGSFVPLEVRPHAGSTEFEHLREAVPLIERITVHEDYRAIVNELLGDVLLIPDLKNGINLWRQNGFCGTFVTPEGDIISPSGILTGGSGNAEKGLLSNRREIAELSEEVERLCDELEEGLARRKHISSLIAQWEEEQLAIRSQLHLSELRINGARKDVERFEGEMRQLRERLKVHQFNRDNLRAETEQTLAKLAECEGQMKSLQERETALNEEISQAAGRWEALRRELDEREGALTELKIQLAALEEKREAQVKAVERLSASLTDRAGEIAAKLADAEACQNEAVALSGRIEADQEALARLFAEHERLEKELTEKRNALEEQQALLRTREAQLRETKKILDEELKLASSLEVSLKENDLQRENLRLNILERCGADVEELAAGFSPLPPEELSALSDRLERDRKAAEAFGEVNLLALEEHEELQKRHEFLTSQVADLNRSIETLQTTITRINAVSRKRFAETFEAVNKCFQEVFVRLFPGGRAELRLTDENDLLETGVDIDLRVPGKRTQSISLLSGGEKSLAAIALIFSVLLYRPVPFLLLDEVDAALDDSNISLFNRLVKETASQSQILVITHNKKTMEIADSLYGVTMQRQGISSLVSVSLS